MRDITTKQDNVGDTYAAAAFNSNQNERENVVTDAGLTLDSAGGPDTDLNMLGKAISLYAATGNYYQDSGSADDYELTKTSSLQEIDAYEDGVIVVFEAGTTNTGASVININSLGDKDFEYADGTALSAGDVVSGDYIMAIYRLSADRFEYIYSSSIISKPKGVIQVVNVETGAVATGSTLVPNVDTIPQITEGDEYMTLAITPTDTTNNLRIDVVWHGMSAVATNMVVALFQDTTANALACTHQYAVNADYNFAYGFTHFMPAGTTSATTFRVRAGCDQAGTTTFNGSVGVREYGGSLASSITITEYSS